MREYTVAQFFAGIGGGCLGFQQARAEYRGVRARFRTVGAVDVDAAACRDLTYLTGASATPLDLFTREDYVAFHGKQPPRGWREATPADIRQAFNNEAPDVVFASPPCKGFSGLLAGRKRGAAKYEALNRLVVRWLFLLLEAFPGQPPKLILFENVPRIQQRGRDLLDRVRRTLSGYGYATTETVHDCGELSGLGQSRTRFLMVARHVPTMSGLLYEPLPMGLRPMGDIIESLPLPVRRGVLPMHDLPNLTRPTLERLSLIPPGKDFRALESIAPDEFRLRRGRFNNVYRVCRWDTHSPAITGGAGPSSGGLAVGDPRLPGKYGPKSVTLRVKGFDRPSPTVTGNSSVWDSGGFSVADPREHTQEPDTLVLIGPHGTWNRPLSTLECAALQGFPTEVRGRPLRLSGDSVTRWRMGIGNAVPPPTARAIAEQMLCTLLVSSAGTFALSGAGGVWVREAGVLTHYDSSRATGTTHTQEAHAHG